jgi:hypothetical protein
VTIAARQDDMGRLPRLPDRRPAAGRPRSLHAPASAIHYATYFDRHYLSRGLAMIESLRRVAPESPIWALCLDEETERVVRALGLPHVRPMGLAELERRDPELAAVRGARSKIEYYFTLTAPFLLDLLDRTPDADHLIYVDADHYFFDTPTPLTAALRRQSVAVIDHRYPACLADKYVYGRYNVGLIGLRRDATARACVSWWRERCMEWCFDRLEGDRYADQKYLEAWPRLFEGVGEVEHRGVGAALWNVREADVVAGEHGVTIDGDPLVAYHFSSFRILGPWLFDSGARMYGFALDAALKHGVYVPYARAIARAERAIRSVGGAVAPVDNIRGEGPRRMPAHLAKIAGRVHAGAGRLRLTLAALRRRSLMVVTDQLAI